MKRLLFLDSVHPSVEERLLSRGFIVDHDYDSSKELVMEKLRNYEGLIIRSRFKIDQEFLSAPHGLKFIGRYGAGLENIDVSFAESQNVTCIRVPEGNRDAVGEQAIGMLLMLLNNLKRADYEVRKGVWKREENRGYEINGKTIGVLGFGYMGSGFVEKLSGFNCEVLVYDKYKEVESGSYFRNSTLEEIFEKADILSVHVPLTEETKFWLDADFWEKFKKPIYVINTARGPILKIAHLMDAIENGSVKGACLDVLEFEKTSFENLFTDNEMPEDFKRLISSGHVILSPHIAGWSFESYQKLADAMVAKILALYP